MGDGVVLGDRQADDPPLPAELRQALREWGVLAGAVARSGGPEEHELVRQRGRLLASRVADVLGRPVEFTDPGTGAVESVHTGPPQRPPPHALRLPTRSLAEPPPPWGTGLPVAGFVAVLTAVADVTLSRAFAEAFGLLWVPANLLVVLGLAPSLYLLRAVPFWRWPAMGAAAGLGAAWLVLLLGLLGQR